MIQLLNNMTFASYGSVVIGPQELESNALFSQTIHTELVISERSTEFQCSQDLPVYLERLSGLVLLLISPDASLNQREMFLLDKPVIIRPGMWFCVNCFQSDACRVLHIQPTKANFLRISAPDDGLEPLMLPKVNINRIYTLFYQEQERGFLFRGECHDFWELTYVDKGYLRSVTDSEEWVLHQSEIMFYGPGQHHVQSADEDVAVCYVTITFDMELEDELALINRKFTADNALTSLLDKILYEKEHSIFYSEDLISCYLKEFVILLIRSCRQRASQTALITNYKVNTENALVAQVSAFIEKNITKHLTVGQVAAEVSVSQSYLSVLFKKHQKCTIIEYINRVKTERCKELIREGKYSFTEISYLLGYTSVHYFSRQFKALVGVSPSEYAKALR